MEPARKRSRSQVWEHFKLISRTLPSTLTFLHTNIFTYVVNDIEKDYNIQVQQVTQAHPFQHTKISVPPVNKSSASHRKEAVM